MQARNPTRSDVVPGRETLVRSAVPVERTPRPVRLRVLPFRAPMPASLEFSAVICTLDRGPEVELAVRSLLEQDLDPQTFEILLIDNGSGPAAAAVLRGLAASHPDRVRYVREERVGESSARNCSLAHARGAILAYLDDDAIADPGWLRAYRDAFAADPGLSVAGGRVRLRYLVDRPDWIDAQMETWLSGFERPPDWLIVQDPWGASLTARLVIKEVRFLLLMMLAALSQVPAGALHAQARTLGYGRCAAWLIAVLPQVYPQLRLPIFAVLAFSVSVVDVSLVLAPNTPPPLAVLLLRRVVRDRHTRGREGAWQISPLRGRRGQQHQGPAGAQKPRDHPRWHPPLDRGGRPGRGGRLEPERASGKPPSRPPGLG